MAPRIEPIAPTGNRADIQEILDTTAQSTGGAQNIFLTAARHPGLFRKWTSFGGKLLMGGKLAARERELAILRTAMVCDCEYEWGQHVRIGLASGVKEAELTALQAGADDPSWSEADATLLRAVDQLVTSHDLSDETWAALSSVYDDRLMVELIMLVGHYAMVAGFLNAARVEIEDGVARFSDSSP